MASIEQLCLSLLLAVAISECVYAAKSRPVKSTSAQISDLSRQLGRLDQKVSTLQRDVNLLKKTNGQLTSDLKSANTKIDRVSTRNEGLQEMLNQFEKFFGTLYSDSEAFDSPTARSVDKKINKLNSYIGDREASLIEANPNFIYTVMGVEHEETETNVTDEMVQSAVLQMATENKEMQNKVNSLEARVVENAKKSSSRGVNDDELALANDRLTKLEDMVSILVTDTTRSPPAARSTAQQKEFENMIEETFMSERSVSSSRKSVFSVSRTEHLWGSSYPQVITFDHVFVNKGDDFSAENGTFYCEWTGYYFFTLTLRSQDDHYIGVSIMKTDFGSKQTDFVTSVYTDADTRNTMEGQSVAIHLAVGDEVWLRMGPSDRYAIYSDPYRYITFSGFLIYKGN